MKRWVLGVCIGWCCWAQAPVTTAEQAQASVMRDLRGEAESRALEPGRSDDPFAAFDMIQSRPSGETVSVERLRHTVPKRARRLAAHAEKLSRAGEDAKAAKELEAAVREDPGFTEAYSRLGIEYAALQRLNAATVAFERVTELEPDAWSARSNLGVMRFRSGDLAGAVREERRALELAPTAPQVNLFLGYLLCLRAEMRPEALPYLRYAARTIPVARELVAQMDSAAHR